MRLSKRRLAAVGAAIAVAATAVAATLPASGAAAAGGKIKIGVALTYNNTAFWTAYISYEKQYAAKYGAQLLGPLLAGTNASLQNTQVEDLVNEGAKAVIVNPETATSLLPAINYAAKHHVQLISVDTIVGAGHVYMVVRASNLITARTRAPTSRANTIPRAAMWLTWRAISRRPTVPTALTASTSA